MKKVVDTIDQLALRLGVSSRTISLYLGRGMPGNQGYYDVDECRAWVAANIGQRPTARESSLDKEGAELEKVQQEARFKRIKNDKLEELLVERDAMVQEWNLHLARMKNRLESFPDEIEMILPTEFRAAVKAELQEKMRLLLLEMASWGAE